MVGVIDEISADDRLADADENPPRRARYLVRSAVAAARRRPRRATPERAGDREYRREQEATRRCGGERHTPPICNAHTAGVERTSRRWAARSASFQRAAFRSTGMRRARPFFGSGTPV